MILSNPVHGTIHPLGWKRPAGNLDLQVTQRFGCTGYPAERPFGNCPHFHRAIDMGNAQYGADIIAAAAGTVTQSGLNPGGALVVVVGHGSGWFTGYAHLQDRVVSVGQHVAKGQKLGDLGASGASGPHLHFAVKKGLDSAPFFWGDTNGTWVDPWPLLAQNTVQGGDMQTFTFGAIKIGALTVKGAGHSYQRLRDGTLHPVPDGFARHPAFGPVKLAVPLPGSGDRATGYIAGDEAAFFLATDVTFVPDATGGTS